MVFRPEDDDQPTETSMGLSVRMWAFLSVSSEPELFISELHVLLMLLEPSPTVLEGPSSLSAELSVAVCFNHAVK